MTEQLKYVRLEEHGTNICLVETTESGREVVVAVELFDQMMRIQGFHPMVEGQVVE